MFIAMAGMILVAGTPRAANYFGARAFESRVGPMHVNFTATTSYGALQYLPDVYVGVDHTPVEYKFDKWTVTRILMKFIGRDIICTCAAVCSSVWLHTRSHVSGFGRQHNSHQRQQHASEYKAAQMAENRYGADWPECYHVCRRSAPLLVKFRTSSSRTSAIMHS